MLNFHESWFLNLAFPRGEFPRISKGKESFFMSKILKGKVANLEDSDPYIFLKNDILNSPGNFLLKTFLN